MAMPLGTLLLYCCWILVISIVLVTETNLIRAEAFSHLSGQMSEQPPSILVVGLNPALQKRFVLGPKNELVPGNVHRSTDVMQKGIGGKGQDVAVALNCLSSSSNFRLAQFLGNGVEGDSLERMLQQHTARTDWKSLTVRTEAKLRTCTTIVAASTSTELVEPSGTISKEEMDRLLQLIRDHPKPTAVVVMGSMPPGCPEETYANILESCWLPSQPTFLLIDSVVGLTPLLAKVQAKPNLTTMLKINVDELLKLVGCQPTTSRETDVRNAIQLFCKDQPPLDFLSLTDGQSTAYFAQLKSGTVLVFEVEPPRLETIQPLYPIGAGDAVSAGTIASWLYLSKADCAACLTPELQTFLDSTDPSYPAALRAFQFGLACAGASCLNTENSVFDPKTAVELFKKVDPSRIVATVHLR